MYRRGLFCMVALVATLLSGKLMAAMARPDTGSEQPALGSAGDFQVSTLLGTAVFNPQGQKLGQIKDLVLDSQAGQATFVVVDAETRAAGHAMLVVPYYALRLGYQPAEHRQIMVLDLRTDQLSAAPKISGNQWQLLRNPFFLEQARSFYPLKTYTAARPIDETSMAPPPAQTVAPQPCVNVANSSSDLPKDLEEFYNE
jgi:hypothetical protein